jgi:hypothetical protein
MITESGDKEVTGINTCLRGQDFFLYQRRNQLGIVELI